MSTRTDKRWLIHSPAPRAFIEHLPVNPWLGHILYGRGFHTVSSALDFLRSASVRSDPFALADMEKAVAIIFEAIGHQERIAVFGDYDVDGITATALLLETLQSMGAQAIGHIPQRSGEGYGLNPAAVRMLARDEIGLLITVDCGIRSVEEIVLARSLGMRVIVTDHHSLGPQLPPADAVLNPRRPENTDEFGLLAGVGVAFKLAQALIRTSAALGTGGARTSPDEESLLDLVALGTVADIVPLIGENRSLVSAGLRRINSARRPGLAALMDVAGVAPGTVDTHTIGYILAPRLNAAGRLDDATLALRLLMAPDMGAALALAERLNAINEDRRSITLRTRDQVMELVGVQRVVPPLIFAASPDFLSGIVGLAASRLVDEFYRPAVVVAIGDRLSKGSARSIPEFHITRALDEVANLLERHGGHAAAAGFTVQTSRLDELRERLLMLAERDLGGRELVPTLEIDAVVPLRELSWEFYRALDRLRPYGEGNPQPVLVSQGVGVKAMRAVGNGGQHLRLQLHDWNGELWDAIAFKQGYWSGRLPQQVDVAYTLDRNVWRGRERLQLRVLDIRPSVGGGGAV